MGTVSARDDPCCLDSPQLVLSLLQGRTLRAAQPTLPKVGKRRPVTGHRSAAMQSIQECSLQTFAVRLSPSQSCHQCRGAGWRTAGSHLAAHTSTKPGLAGSGDRKAFCCDGAHRGWLRAQNPLGGSLHPAREAVPSTPAALLRGHLPGPAPGQLCPGRSAGSPSQLTCQVQLQRARRSSADQSQLGHHHIWSIGI